MWKIKQICQKSGAWKNPEIKESPVEIKTFVIFTYIAVGDSGRLDGSDVLTKELESPWELSLDRKGNFFLRPGKFNIFKSNMMYYATNVDKQK